MESLVAVTTRFLDAGSGVGGSAIGAAGFGSTGAVTFAGDSAVAAGLAGDAAGAAGLGGGAFFAGELGLAGLGLGGGAGLTSFFFSAPFFAACHAGTWEAALLGCSFFDSGCLE